MNNHITTLFPAPSFFTLSLRPQLFLWTIRHHVYAAKWNRPVCPHVQKTFDLAQISDFPLWIDDLLRAVAQHAIRPIEVAHPQSNELLKDERSLVDCLRSFQTQPEVCACHYFSDMIDPGGLDSVMPRMACIAEKMSQCQRMAPLFCANEPLLSATTSFTVH